MSLRVVECGEFEMRGRVNHKAKHYKGNKHWYLNISFLNNISILNNFQSLTVIIWRAYFVLLLCCRYKLTVKLIGSLQSEGFSCRTCPSCKIDLFFLIYFVNKYSIFPLGKIKLTSLQALHLEVFCQLHFLQAESKFDNCCPVRLSNWAICFLQRLGHLFSLVLVEGLRKPECFCFSWPPGKPLS